LKSPYHIISRFLELAMAIALDRYIETTPDIRSGRPRIADTRIAVADVVLMYLRLGQSLEEIAGKYDLPLAAVYAAIAYYYTHQSEIDQSIAADQAFAEAFRNNNPSPLRAKLQSLRHG
jgi:uncharacterized protein (DUF433 family)